MRLFRKACQALEWELATNTVGASIPIHLPPQKTKALCLPALVQHTHHSQGSPSSTPTVCY